MTPGPASGVAASVGRVRAITVRQPWAALIASGRKDVENRTRGTLYRGPLLIHAARQLAPVAWPPDVPPDAPRGAFVALGRLDDVHRCDGACSPWAASDRWHYVIADVRPIPPRPASGRLGVWPVVD